MAYGELRERYAPCESGGMDDGVVRLGVAILSCPCRSSLAPRRLTLAASAYPYGPADRHRWVRSSRSFACRPRRRVVASRASG